MLTHQASHGVATEIHKCPGLGQQQFLIPYLRNAYSSPALPVVKANRMEPGKVIVKVIDLTGKILLSFSSGASSGNKDDQVTEIIFDTQHKIALINGIEHPYHNKGQFVLKDNKLIKK